MGWPRGGVASGRGYLGAGCPAAWGPRGEVGRSPGSSRPGVSGDGDRPPPGAGVVPRRASERRAGPRGGVPAARPLGGWPRSPGPSGQGEPQPGSSRPRCPATDGRPPLGGGAVPRRRRQVRARAPRVARRRAGPPTPCSAPWPRGAGAPGRRHSRHGAPSRRCRRPGQRAGVRRSPRVALRGREIRWKAGSRHRLRERPGPGDRVLAGPVPVEPAQCGPRRASRPAPPPGGVREQR